MTIHYIDSEGIHKAFAEVDGKMVETDDENQVPHDGNIIVELNDKGLLLETLKFVKNTPKRISVLEYTDYNKNRFIRLNWFDSLVISYLDRITTLSCCEGVDRQTTYYMNYYNFQWWTMKDDNRYLYLEIWPKRVD